MSETVSYPKVSSNAWRTLRAKAATAPSTKFTPTGVAALLGMANPKSAGDNVVYPMRKLGLIDEEGTLTDRGNKWRVDGTYAAACEEIIADVYPDELASLTGDAGQPDKSKVVTWLQHKGLGESNASQMASTYVMIAEKTVPEQAAASNPKPKNTVSKPRKVEAQEESIAQKEKESDSSGGGRDGGNPNSPNIHLDIQIHIPATATPEQIDGIFASMAKHLYKN